MKGEMRTIARDPQYGTIFLPLIECSALDKPIRCCLMLFAVRCAMTDGRIRRIQPRSKVVSQLDLCKVISATVIHAVETSESNERLCPSIAVSASEK